MSLTPLDNPLERLGVLPNAMNWRGGWSATEQYYLNDCVVSPINNSTYILAGQTALLGGADPTLNPDWIELAAASTGVLSVSGTFPGITITGTGTNPIVNNDGVVRLLAGSGMNVSAPNGTVTVSNNGVRTIIPGTGISTSGTNNVAITNTGVTQITTGAGITASSNTGIVGLSNTGVVSIATPPGPGISASSSTGAITLSNTGVTDLTAGPGISLSGSTGSITIGASGLTTTLGTATSGSALGSNNITFGGGLAGFNLVQNAVYLFSIQLAIIGPSTGGTALLEVSGTTLPVGPAFIGSNYAVPALAGGQSFGINVTGIISSQYVADPLIGTLFLVGSGAGSVVYRLPTLVRLL